MQICPMLIIAARRVCGGRLTGPGLLVLVSSSLVPQVNVMAVSICTREAYQSMKERNIDDGHIININRYMRWERRSCRVGLEQRTFTFPGGLMVAQGSEGFPRIVMADFPNVFFFFQISACLNTTKAKYAVGSFTRLHTSLLSTLLSALSSA